MSEENLNKIERVSLVDFLDLTLLEDENSIEIEDDLGNK